MCTKNFLLNSVIITDLEEMTDEEKAFINNPCDRNYEALERAHVYPDAGRQRL